MAFERHRKRCDAGTLTSCVEVGRYFEEGVSVRPDLERAKELYQQACDARLVLGCVYLGVLMIESGQTFEPSFVLGLLTDACDQGEQLACSELGWAYAFGGLVQRDPKRGRELMEQACSKKNVDACAAAAHLESMGIGGPPDLRRALERAEKACKGGSAMGCNNAGYEYDTGRFVPTDRHRGGSFTAIAS